jgi:hypothetical protein
MPRVVGEACRQKVIVPIYSNGLGSRNASKCDTDSDADVGANDKKCCFAYDGPWRQVGTYRETDTTPKEEFFHHAAGADGMGGSSYIDSVVLRDKDANTSWTSAADGTLEERRYYNQNWRAPKPPHNQPRLPIHTVSLGARAGG